MVMLGALLEISNRLPHSSIEAALALSRRNSKWLAVDERALAREGNYTGIGLSRFDMWTEEAALSSAIPDF